MNNFCIGYHNTTYTYACFACAHTHVCLKSGSVKCLMFGLFVSGFIY